MIHLEHVPAESIGRRFSVLIVMVAPKRWRYWKPRPPCTGFRCSHRACRLRKRARMVPNWLMWEAVELACRHDLREASLPKWAARLIIERLNPPVLLTKPVYHCVITGLNPT